MADRFPEKVLQTVAAHTMCKAGDRVLVALSGGADSVALLHVILALREKIGLKEVSAERNRSEIPA